MLAARARPFPGLKDPPALGLKDPVGTMINGPLDGGGPSRVDGGWAHDGLGASRGRLICG